MEATKDESSIAVSSSPVDDFNFPFTPYAIQRSFMRALYETLESKKRVGVFESPTGTGKSLSLLCASVTWLKESERRRAADLDAELPQVRRQLEECKRDDDWLNAYDRQMLLEQQLQQLEKTKEEMTKLQSRLEELVLAKRGRLKERQLNCTLKVGSSSKKRLPNESADEIKDENDDDVDVDADIAPPLEYFSDGEGTAEGGAAVSAADGNAEDDSVCSVPKIYYCSRTHSQLVQFLGEVKKTIFADQLRVVILGSRQTLCVNDAVKTLNNGSLINERCLEMQNHSSKGTKVLKGANRSIRRSSASVKKCPFYNMSLVKEFADVQLTQLHTPDSLRVDATQAGVCSYYSSRFATPLAELVLLPYQILLHDATREAWRLQLTDSVVIVDEAHNLLDAVASMYSVRISAAQLKSAHGGLRAYADKFTSRLKAKNLMYVRQLLAVICCIMDTVNAVKAEETFRLHDFKLKAGMDDFNLYKIGKYLDQSQLCKKLHGFSLRYGDRTPQVTIRQKGNVPTDDGNTSASSAMYAVKSLLEALTVDAQDGRLIISKEGSENRLKFALLNPADRLKNLLSFCRCVILAGGTMEPSDELTYALTSVCSIKPEEITRFSCGHVIGKGQLLPLVMDKGPTGLRLNFAFDSRSTDETLDELGRVLLNISRVCPAGTVVFLPSYDYSDVVWRRMEKTGTIEKLKRIKAIYRESKVPGELEKMLHDFGKSASHANGALLFAVVGGKMSEGINFSDDLGRCVLVVGLPYANRNSPELQEKMKYLDKFTTRSTNGGLPSQQHYENLCMKAVNQTIGRVIRHQHDYAAILLLDDRYRLNRIRSKLPGWIASETRMFPENATFAQPLSALVQFFKPKR